MSWSTRTTYHGKRVNAGTLAIVNAANKMLATKEFGSEKEPVTMVQGGYNKGGVKASVGTHDGGGAFDLTPYNWKNRVKALRILGCAASHRPTLRGYWSEHIHTIVSGDGTASSGAKAQVKSYYKGRNGLANNAKDTDWRPHGLPILFHLDGDLSPRYATKNATVRDSPSVRGKKLATIKKGDTLTPVAVIKNGAKNYWFITADGKCGYEGHFTTKKPSTPPGPTQPAATDFLFLHKSHKEQTIAAAPKWTTPAFLVDGKTATDFTADKDGLLVTRFYAAQEIKVGKGGIVRARLVRHPFGALPLDPTAYDERPILPDSDGFARVGFMYVGLAEKGRTYHWEIQIVGDATATLTGTHYAEFWRR